MKQYEVTGMSCAACSARVEKAVSKIEGVTSCSVNLLTNSMGVEGAVDAQTVIEAVEAAGYKAAEKESRTGQEAGRMEKSGELKDKETPEMKKRLIASLCFLIPLMYLSMGHMMWGWKVPEIVSENHVAMGIIQLLLTTAVMVINQKFFISGVRGLFHKAPNMDTLVALGAGASYGYSIYALFAMTDAQMRGNAAEVMTYMHEFYFESAAMILTLITVGKLLEARSKGKTTDALKGLMGLAPKTATVVRGGEEVKIGIEQVQKGDLFVVRPGESIPTDGIVVEGSGAVDESALTGESIPVDKKERDCVSGATINQSGFLRCKATRVGEDTTLSQIIHMVGDAAATKAPIAKVADKVSGVFVPVVMAVAVLTIIVWLAFGETIGFALARGISVLVISCPCALGLATPVAIMVGNGVGAKNGILFKTAVSLEETGKIDVVVLDKTGTITKGRPTVTDILPGSAFSESELLTYAYILEKKSEHPLAHAILKKAEEEAIQTKEEAKNFTAVSGNGLTGEIGGDKFFGGNLKFAEGRTVISEAVRKQAESFASEGKTPLFFGRNEELIGIIAVADIIKEDSPQAVRELKNMGIKVVMLTGDNERTAKAIAAKAGVDEYYSEVLPEDKASFVEKEKNAGRKVIMIGDGINDSPALSAANVGIAISDGAELAREIADVTIGADNLYEVVTLKLISNHLMKRINWNYRTIVGFNAGLIALGVLGILPPATSALLHNTSTLLIGLKSMKNLLPE